jgi:hypothetical protein
MWGSEVCIIIGVVCGTQADEQLLLMRQIWIELEVFFVLFFGGIYLACRRLVTGLFDTGALWAERAVQRELFSNEISEESSPNSPVHVARTDPTQNASQNTPLRATISATRNLTTMLRAECRTSG